MRVSVIIPVLNGEAYLAQTIRSVLNQTNPAAEIIVVDNGSEDQSLAIANSFGGIVRAIACTEAGASAARNAGAAEAVGDALMFLDADDLLGPTVLEELSSALAGHPEAIACCPWMRYELEDGCWLARPASCAPRRPGHDDLAAWLTGWYHPPCAVLWSRAAFEATGGWDPQVGVNDDGDLMMRAFSTGIALVRTTGAVSYYRRLPGGAISLSGRRATRKGIEDRLRVLDRIAQILEEGDRVAHYRSCLAEAYADVAQDCSDDDADLRGRAEDAVKSFGGFGRVRRTSRSVGRAVSRRIRTRRHVAAPAPAENVEAPDDGVPLVSVVVPTYNRALLLRRAIDSVLAQTYDNLELLIVDDGSTDETPAVIDSIGDQRLRYFRQPHNMGVAAARNRGIREARGAFIAFLDSDDEWKLEKLRCQVKLMRRRPAKVGLVFTGLTVREAGEEGPAWTPSARGDVFADMLHQNIVHFGTSSTMIRREVVDTVGFFDEKMPANEDHDYWTRIARFYEFDFVPDPLIIYNHEVNEAAPVERRSLNFGANMSARKMFMQRHGDDAALAGVRHLYHLDCAKRHLYSAYGDSWQARWLLAKALRDRPREPRLYMWLAFASLPRKPRTMLAPALQSVRKKLPPQIWFGSGSG